MVAPSEDWEDGSSSPLSSPPASLFLETPEKWKAEAPDYGDSRAADTDLNLDGQASQSETGPTKDLQKQLKEIAVDKAEQEQIQEAVTAASAAITEEATIMAAGTKPMSAAARRSQAAKEREAAKKAKVEAEKWKAPFVYTDPDSPLANADLRAILLHPRAWDCLPPAARAEVIALFPPELVVGAAAGEEGGARPDAAALANDDGFRADCARYAENLAAGKFDPQWQRDAWAAHERQKAGRFDRYVVGQFERDWGVPMPREHYPPALLREQKKKEEEAAAAAAANEEEEEEAEEEGEQQNGKVAEVNGQYERQKHSAAETQQEDVEADKMDVDS